MLFRIDFQPLIVKLKYKGGTADPLVKNEYNLTFVIYFACMFLVIKG